MTEDQYWEAQWLIGRYEMYRSEPSDAYLFDDQDEETLDFLLSLEKPSGTWMKIGIDPAYGDDYSCMYDPDQGAVDIVKRPQG